ncbi:MAG: hypothetical protein JWP14_301 [Frankiales bacterium]|jgi:hypothetical protein|nr:hypothetical protein [Frankiales bacterium]
MTENSFTALAEDVEEAPSRKPLLLVGAATGVAVLAGAGWFLLHGGSSSNTSYALPVPHHAALAAGKPAKVTSKSNVPTTNKLPAASPIKIGRDPFLALYVVPASAPATSTTTGTSPTGTTTAGSTTTGTTATGATTPTTRYVLVLKGVTRDPGGARLFTFTVDGASKTVLPAQRFGKYGELVVLATVTNSKGAVTGAVVQVGDDSPIAVPIGAKVSVL